MFSSVQKNITCFTVVYPVVFIQTVLEKNKSTRFFQLLKKMHSDARGDDRVFGQV